MMASTIPSTGPTQSLLHNRLLNDIAELQKKPYPGIELRLNDKNALQKACLILSPENEPPLHLRIVFSADYPLSPPTITIQSRYLHPNVFDGYICASILNTHEGYTSAYTLKGICIQLLSFFSDDTVEQMYGLGTINRKDWVRKHIEAMQEHDIPWPEFSFMCRQCDFPDGNRPGCSRASSPQTITFPEKTSNRPSNPNATLSRLPAEVILNIGEFLDDEELLVAARTWNGLAAVISRYNILRTRELQCFTLKQSFRSAILGVGVAVKGRMIESEFDLISYPAFFDLNVRTSVQGVNFDYWLPLALSRAHWLRARENIDEQIESIATAAGLKGPSITVLYGFMSDVVVRLSKDASDVAAGRQSRYWMGNEQKSTLRVVSEKAIESYFHLFHLLLCLATERTEIAQQADEVIETFLQGKVDKQSVPNLGHLLIMVLVSTKQFTEPLTKAIIREAVTRNVVWMLDERGSNMPELSYLETDAISEYRLQNTFDASKTSYRLLMFANLMRKEVTAVTTSDGQRTSLAELRDKMFARHGAPPNGAAAGLADSVKKIQDVSTFPEFLKAMDISAVPSASEFTAFLRRTVQESADKGYSKFALSQRQAFAFRLRKEPEVGRTEDMREAQHRGRISFFPEDRKRRKR